MNKDSLYNIGDVLYVDQFLEMPSFNECWVMVMDPPILGDDYYIVKRILDGAIYSIPPRCTPDPPLQMLTL